MSDTAQTLGPPPLPLSDCGWVPMHLADEALMHERLAHGRNASALAVWCALLKTANCARGCTFTASLNQLARHSGMATRTVQRALADLQQIGLLQRQTRRAAGSKEYEASEYVLPDHCRLADARGKLGHTHGELGHTPYGKSCQGYGKATGDGLAELVRKEEGKKLSTTVERAQPPAAGAAAPKGGDMPAAKRATPRQTRAQQHDDAVAAAAIPTKLDTPEFRQQWQRWCDKRREMGKYHTATSVQASLEKLLAYPVEAATQALLDAASAGYQGVFPKATASGAAPDRRGLALGQILDSRKRDYSLTPEQQEEARGLPF
jgi:hypothetical protein